MKRVFFSFLGIAMTVTCMVQASSVSMTDARQVADQFFMSAAHRSPSRDGQSPMRLAYTAQQGRFYVFDRGVHGGFVIVSGDDRLPQVLGYGAEGDFSSAELPPAVKYWMESLDQQIAFLQSHDEVPAHRPAPRSTAVGPLLTTRWYQDTPYNNYCPPLGDGYRSATGCVATAFAQVMNYYQWPPVGMGSHSYVCLVGGIDSVELSADFSQSVYRWDLMLDTYDENSSPESCDAVARLMFDIGVSADMNYGDSSGAWEYDASNAMKWYFGYCDKCYWLRSEYYSAEQWEQLLVDEIGKNRPMVYCGNAVMQGVWAGHAFVLDGFDTEGYFHVNWGWGGAYDGYYLVALLDPANYSFFDGQRGLFGLVPESQADEVDDVLFVSGVLSPRLSSVPLGTQAIFELDIIAGGNMQDTIGYEEWGGEKYYYTLIPFKLSVFDRDDEECANQVISYYNYLYFDISGDYCYFDVPQSLSDGEYKVKLFYSTDGGVNFDHQVIPAYISGKELYTKMIVHNDTAYFKDRFLSYVYGADSFVVPAGVKVDQNFEVSVNVSYMVDWEPEFDFGPTGNVYLSLLKDGVEVAASPMCEVGLSANTTKTCVMQLTAPSEPGLYDLVVNDESGTHMVEKVEWLKSIIDVDVSTVPVYVLPNCPTLTEDFETMTANSSTSDQDVQGRFTTWGFTKSGVRAPGEGKCNGTNAVMLKKPSTLYTTRPLSHDFIMAQAVFFNPSTTPSKYRLEYSLDGGTTWETANALDRRDAVEVPAKSRYVAVWPLDLKASQPALFRIAMFGGGTGSTYVDDISLFYLDKSGDVNTDGTVNISDLNAVIDLIFNESFNDEGDLNGDGQVNIADVNAIIHIILEK